MVFTKNTTFSTKNTKNRHKCALRPSFCRGDKLYQPDRKMRPALSCVALRPFFQHHCRCHCRWLPLMSAAPALCPLRPALRCSIFRCIFALERISKSLGLGRGNIICPHVFVYVYNPPYRGFKLNKKHRGDIERENKS